MKTCRGIAWGLVCPKLEQCTHHRPDGWQIEHIQEQTA